MAKPFQTAATTVSAFGILNGEVVKNDDIVRRSCRSESYLDTITKMRRFVGRSKTTARSAHPI